VDIRHIATLVDQAETALHFHDVIGYDMPVVSGLIRTRERAIVSMGCATYGEIEEKLQRGIDRRCRRNTWRTAPHKQVMQTGTTVDLFRLPVPMSSDLRRRPDDHGGRHHRARSGVRHQFRIYRFMVKEKNLTGIDIVTPNNMRLFAQRAYEAGRPCPISISIGTHPFEIMGSGFRAPLGVDEMAVAGGIRGAPSSWRNARRWICRASPTRKSCSRGDICRPAGRCPRAASGSSRG
jgi:2,5-furandicarboxylate decarboxylase 1